MFNSKRNSLSLEGSTGNSLKSLKLISLIIIILLLTLITLPPDIGKAFNIKPRKKIPLSPPPISIDSEKQTKPVEAKEKRTEHSKTFKNPDGTFSLFYYPRKIHKRDGKGGWVDIDSVNEGNKEKEIKTLSGGNPTQYEWMQASYAYQGSGVGREAIWENMKRLSHSKHYGYSIIWNWDPKKCYVEIDEETGKIMYPKYRY